MGDYYNSNILLKSVNVPINFTMNEAQEYYKCKTDVVYFIKNYCKIISLDYGLVPFKMYDCQERVIREMDNNRKVILMVCRQFGKTILSAAYILWYTLFNESKNVAILANKATAAREVLSRYQLMYENIPVWMQHGVRTWNKGDIELENGSKVFTAATSASGIRGKSCVTGDTRVTIKNLLNNQVSQVEILKLLNNNSIKDFEILTPIGFRKFKGILNQGVSNKILCIKFSDSTHIKVTEDHKLMVWGNWVHAKDLEIDDILSEKRIISIDKSAAEVVYDAYEVEGVHSYITNGVISHNCNLLYVDEVAIIPNNIAEQFFTSIYPTISSGTTTKIILSSTPLGYNHFWKYWNDAEQKLNDFKNVFVPYWEVPGRDINWANEQRKLLGEFKFQQEVECSFLGSSNTLINSGSLQFLTAKRPIYTVDGLDIIEKAKTDNVYVMVVDTSKGVGGDYSAFVIVDITNIPYTVVGKYRNNTISPLLYPNIIYKVAKEYNEAYVLVEINSSEQVAYILKEELEYENLLSVTKDKNGQVISIRYKNSRAGIQTDKKVKRIGCTTLKSLIEENNLVINDIDIIKEFSTFIEVSSSYEAEKGYHDDLVMCLVLFGWLTTDTYFSTLNDINIRKTLYENEMKMIDEELLPVGWFNDGNEDDNEIPINF